MPSCYIYQANLNAFVLGIRICILNILNNTVFRLQASSTSLNSIFSFYSQEGEPPAPPLPPDGGWGWVVVFASLVCNIIVDGICFSFGMFFIELIDYYGESKGKTAFVGSLIPGMYLGMGKYHLGLNYSNSAIHKASSLYGSLPSHGFDWYNSVELKNVHWLWMGAASRNALQRLFRLYSVLRHWTKVVFKNESHLWCWNLISVFEVVFTFDFHTGPNAVIG